MNNAGVTINTAEISTNHTDNYLDIKKNPSLGLQLAIKSRKMSLRKFKAN